MANPRYQLRDVVWGYTAYWGGWPCQIDRFLPNNEVIVIWFGDETMSVLNINQIYPKSSFPKSALVLSTDSI